MKTLKQIAMLFILLNVFIGLTPQKTTAQVSVNFQLFYNDLSPHGYWVNDPNYGYVWAPNVQQGFTPYNTNGYWVFTDYGWTWVSNYSWGWAPFHYGRWFYDPYYGWLWAPDTEWGPAWVTWRRSEGYYGWAPIGPGISINIAFGSSYNLPYNQWTFVRDRYIGSTNINNYYVNTSNNVTIINNSTVINNIQTNNSTRSKYNAGPDRADVQRRTGVSVKQISLKERDRPGQSLNKNELQLYKPRVAKIDNEGRKPIPPKVVSKEDIKPISERNKDARVIKETPRPVKETPRVNENRDKQVIKEREIKNQRSEPQVREQDAPKKQNGQNKAVVKPRETPRETPKERNEQLNKQKELQQERGNQQNKQQEVLEQKSEQLNKQKDIQRERTEQQNKQQDAQQQRSEQLNKQKEIQQKQSEELDKQVEILNEHGKQQNKQLDVKQAELEKQRVEKEKKEKKDFEDMPAK
ncbi:DUF6600 domain-containing protein [Flavobacterium pedocola]